MLPARPAARDFGGLARIVLALVLHAIIQFITWNVGRLREGFPAKIMIFALLETGGSATFRPVNKVNDILRKFFRLSLTRYHVRRVVIAQRIHSGRRVAGGKNGNGNFGGRGQLQTELANQTRPDCCDARLHSGQRAGRTWRERRNQSNRRTSEIAALSKLGCFEAISRLSARLL